MRAIPRLSSRGVGSVSYHYTLSDASMFLLPFQNRVGDGGCEIDVPGTHYVAGTYTHARQAQSTFNASEGYDNIYLRNGAALFRKL